MIRDEEGNQMMDTDQYRLAMKLLTKFLTKGPTKEVYKQVLRNVVRTAKEGKLTEDSKYYSFLE